jgi:carboxypeptidase Q
MKRSATFICSLAVILCCIPAVRSQERQEKVDLETITRIRNEGFHNSQVMELASGLMDAIGERLTGSPNMKRANEWTRDKLTEMGLSNARLEAWGPFGRGWANQYVNVRMTAPDIAPLIAYAKAWTPGTNGVVTANAFAPTSKRRKISTGIAGSWRA